MVFINRFYDIYPSYLFVHVVTCIVVVQQAKVENLQRLYEIDDHPERRAWLDKLLSFMEDRGTPITQCPTISKNPLDLYRLYIYTKDRGGFLEVCIYIILHDVHSLVFSTMYTVQFTVLCTLFSVHCSMHSTLYTMHCVLCSV